MLSLNEEMITEGYAWDMMGAQNKRTLRNSERFVDHSAHWIKDEVNI